jgi:diketogulonate reductase-like aldo/keto reductase
MIARPIPSSGEELPTIGLGTWQTFDIPDLKSYPTLEEVLRSLHGAGGRVIDSSPMYGLSEQVVGAITASTDIQNDFFYATKVWTRGLEEGIRQMETSVQRMGRTTMDLMQIHNLIDWKTHLPQLRRWKETGKIRYIGLTHYTDSSHEELEKLMRTENVDFIQFNYSIAFRHAEKRLLDAAQDLGVATLINRPLGEGQLFHQVMGKPLPPWAKSYGIDTWACYFLKYLLAHPAVTCVIPATSNPVHALENLKAGTGELPDRRMKKRMLEYLQKTL